MVIKKSELNYLTGSSNVITVMLKTKKFGFTPLTQLSQTGSHQCGANILFMLSHAPPPRPKNSNNADSCGSHGCGSELTASCSGRGSHDDGSAGESCPPLARAKGVMDNRRASDCSGRRALEDSLLYMATPWLVSAPSSWSKITWNIRVQRLQTCFGQPERPHKAGASQVHPIGATRSGSAQHGG